MQILPAIWNVIWWFFTVFVFVAYLMALFSIITDLFRDRELSGIVKAVWLLFLVGLPFVTALAYLIFRGKGMSERSAAQARTVQQATDDYVRSVASSGPSSEIAQAKALLDAGTITATEFAQLKAAALAKAS